MFWNRKSKRIVNMNYGGWKLTEAIANDEGLAASPGAIINTDCPTAGVSDGVNGGQARNNHAQE